MKKVIDPKEAIFWYLFHIEIEKRLFLGTNSYRNRKKKKNVHLLAFFGQVFLFTACVLVFKVKYLKILYSLFWVSTQNYVVLFSYFFLSEVS